MPPSGLGLEEEVPGLEGGEQRGYVLGLFSQLGEGFVLFVGLPKLFFVEVVFGVPGVFLVFLFVGVEIG